MLLPGNASSGWAGVAGLNLSEAHDAGSSPEAVVVPLVFGLIFVVGLVGNSLVMLVICGVRCSGAGGGGGAGRRTGSTTNIFILNLSVADLLFLLFCVPLQATVYSLPQWEFGSFLCSFGHFFFTVSMLVSVFTLVAMSVDRYVAVVRSNQAPCVRSRRNALVGACVIWTLSVACAWPVAQHQYLTSHPSAPNSTFCWEHWSSAASRRAYRVSVLLLGYLLPLLLISCCYTRVLFHLYKKMKTMSQKSESVKRKTTQIVLLVIGAFTICWMPHHIIAMWVEFGSFPLNDATFAFRLVSHCLSYGNSCINPVLYAFLSENFRKSCRKVFSCRSPCPPAPRGKVVRVPMENFSSTTNVGMSVIR